ncbi:anthranilate phosphoribosyltransferase [Desulfatitalea alkaliphila]|uniref:Anthranilate phosphoribosyltransferase n=1 Tax=Desulfatitalea alkaliphila TaxID=2929485 RepID=A0AA41R3B8_9BACT|nr:anthranilate phosphoribosyltransferase [Desulfatitalea alkaliphila]MCJ8500135.1 anthranilate phosphoribosyltransferase [Desulfatitalea alkaliphila]
MIKPFLSKIIQRQNLTAAEMAEMMHLVLTGQASEAQIGAMMAALATKGETFEELAGAARAMRGNARRIQALGSPVVDTCGTGGDGVGSFNISTTTAFVVAGCGVTVAKHGNRSVSSKCGSADVLEVLGVKLDTDPEIVEEAVQSIGIGFLFAPLYHSAMKYAAKPRQELGVRSIFNMLGPLTNPASANCQLLGVFAPALTEMFARALQLLGTRSAMVVHGHDGLDEISVCAPTRVSELKADAIRTYDIHPEQYFGGLADPADMAGGDPPANAAITRAILEGEKGPRRNVVLINAGAALVAADKAADLRQGIDRAAAAIDQGKAMEKLQALAAYTQENG